MILPLTFYGDPLLRRPADPVRVFDEVLRKLSEDMIETMRAENGIGLAGPQIGQSLRVFVMEIPSDMDCDEEGQRENPGLDGPLVVVNPRFEQVSGRKEEMEEGCLSIPEIRGKVTRPLSLVLHYQDLRGAACSLPLTGLAARCAQHETDHLDGILFIDRLSQVKRLALKGKLRKLKESCSP